MAAPTRVPAPSAASPPPPPPPAPPAEAGAKAAQPVGVASRDAGDGEEDEEQREFLLNALDVAGDWSAHDDGDGRIFYYNRQTRASQWSPPDGFTGLEGELMMKLMLESAVERSGHWTAHDAGDGRGSLFYFNAKTRESVWERPSDWGVLPPLPPPPVKPTSAERKEGEEAEPREAKGDASEEKKDKKKEKKKKRKKEKKQKDESGAYDGDSEQASEPALVDEPGEKEEEQEEEEDPEELAEAKRREEAHMKHIAQFRAMLREKNIMPFCRWSVALPQIAGDTRFMGISTMDERREIFEHFVKHRREDLKAEKKQKLKQAKKVFEELLVEQFKGSWVDANTTLSVFLAALEDHVDAARHKLLQDESLAYLTIDVQEKLYAKAMSEFQAKEQKRNEQAKRLSAFLEKEMATAVLSWEDPKTQGLLEAFRVSEASSSTRVFLSVEEQQDIFRDVSQRLQPTREKMAPPIRPDTVRENQRPREEPNSPREDRRRRDRDRGRSRSRSRSHSRRRTSSRDRSEEDDRRHHHSSRSRRRGSRSPSRSRSRSRRRHRRSRHGRRSSSSSRSRSRSRSRSQTRSRHRR